MSLILSFYVGASEYIDLFQTFIVCNRKRISHHKLKQHYLLYLTDFEILAIMFSILPQITSKTDVHNFVLKKTLNNYTHIP